MGMAALAQEEGFDLPKVMADFWASKEGKDVIAQYTSPNSQVNDPAGDAEFSSGETPGLALDPFLDLRGSRVARFNPPPDGAAFFDPVSGGGVVCDDRDTDGPVPDVRTICPDGYDPTAYGDGSWVGVLDLAGPIGFFNLSMTCEWVMWYRDPNIPGVFQPLDAYPLDPAGGTNTAIGLRAEPSGVHPFRLVLTDQGGFADMPTNSVVAIGGNQLALFTPSTEMGQPAQARAYTFCTEGGYQAADSVADSTDIFEPPANELAFVAPTTTSTTSTTTTTTSTTLAPTTSAPPVTSPPTTVATSSGGFPWPVLVLVGLVLAGVGAWLLASKKGCEDELAAWLKAKKACDDARAAAEKASKKVDNTKEDLENAEDELDKLHEDVPPLDWEGDPSDSWVENPEVPGSRIDRFDLHVRRSWASAQWGKYRSGEITAQEVEKAWDTDPPESFAKDLRDKYHKAKTRKKELEDKVSKDEKSLQQAKDDQAKAEREADRACEKAEEARKAYERCMNKPTTPSAAPGVTGTGTGVRGGTGTSTGASPDQPEGCHDGDPEELRNVKSIRVNVPVRMEPVFAGGAAHAASQQGQEIGAGLKQASTVVQAFGRFLSFKSGAKLVHEFDVKTAANLGVSGASEVTGIPIPTSVAGAATGVAKVAIDAAGAIITKVTKLQERRLNDVDLTVTIKAEPITLTCAEVWVCRNGVRVLDKKRLTIEKGHTMSIGSRHWDNLTWAQAHERAASFGAGRYQRSLKRALRDLAEFQAKCAGG